MLDTEVSFDQKNSGLDALFSLLGVPNLKNSPAILNPSTKALFIYMDITKEGVSRLTLTTGRGEALSKCKGLLSHSGFFKSNNLTNDEKCCVICPYYKSEYGQKRSEGHRVEEGEGLGPRKELFSIISEDFTSQWETIDDIAVEGSGKDGYDEIQIDEDDDFSDFVGCQIGVELHNTVCTRKILSQMSHRNDCYKIDRAWSDSFKKVALNVSKRKKPILTYKKECEGVFINTSLVKSQEHVVNYRFLGVLMGLTIVNQTQIDLSLPTLFFEILLGGSDFEVSLDSLGGFDEPLRQRILEAKKWGEHKWREVVELEGGEWSEGGTFDDYAKYVLNSTIIEATSWQMESIRAGFDSILSPTVLRNFSLTAVDCKNIVCGTSDSANDDFDFRDIFQVVTDSELIANADFHDIFWEVISSFTVKQKRDLLLFITGISKLPAKGSEFLTIEMPFLPISVEDHNKMLRMVPQSHTCDNILEIPNYWEAVVKSGDAPDGNVGERVRQILREKLLVSIDFCKGYGLDAVEGGEGGDGNDGGGGGGGLDDLLGREKKAPVDDDKFVGPMSPVMDIPTMMYDDEEEEEEKKEAVTELRAQKSPTHDETLDQEEDEEDYGDESFDDSDDLDELLA